MTPYYEEDGITIYHGDCREILPEVKADAVVTDPPYGTGLYPSDKDVLTLELFRTLLAHSPTLAVFGWPERLIAQCVKSQTVPTEWITWWATNAAIKSFHLHGLRREVECIAVFGPHGLATLRVDRPKSAWLNPEWYDRSKDVRSRRPRGNKEAPTMTAPDVWRDASPGIGIHSKKRLHPNEKPLSLMRKLVEGVSESGDLILDPFMGSGTTLRAAKDLGRRAVGIEIEERWCEAAVLRLAQGVLAL